jgi:broad specificity phosphatase PhoE
VANADGIYQGQLDGGLSELGKEQAKKVAKRLKSEKIGFIYSSDLERAAETAKEIARFHKNAPFKFVKELRERNLGELQGKPRKERRTEEEHRIFENPKNGENMDQFFGRVKRFLHKTLEKHSSDAVLLVTHNGVNKALLAVISGKSSRGIRDVKSIRNTSVSIYEINEDKKHRINLFDCVKHLD